MASSSNPTRDLAMHEGLSRVESDPAVNKVGKSQEQLAEDDREIHTKLDEDTYGAALFSIVTDVSELCGSRPNTDGRPKSLKLLRLVFVNLVLATNYFLQFGMLYFIKTFVVNAAAMEAYEEELSEIKHHALMTVLVKQHPKFLALILVLWTLSSLIELRKVENFVAALQSLPWVSELGAMMHPDTDFDGNPTWEIKGLTTGVYLAIMISITLPKILIVVGLFLLGVEWLASTKMPGDLILNALALAFVVNIDEQLYQALIPATVKEKMQFVTLTSLKPVYASREEERLVNLRSDRRSYLRSILYLMAPIAASVFYIMYQQYKIEELIDEV
eukprot:TRINITY_DN25350_c0_g1_i1.p1 TRINITY_DN25350_c0_g1~~TRINITY_DN25350_c0_g1_i1.p1  ORF type:complete len:331 (-),score=65.27 TRINITY_DN25350_c0_g1_i1:236-1228(-)